VEIDIVDMPETTVLGMRKKGRYEAIGGMIPELCAFAGTRGIPMAGPPAFVCHESTPEQAQKANADGTADLEVVVPIGRKTRGRGDFKCYTLRGGKMARVVHEGPYKDVGGTYLRLFEWLGRNGKALSGPIREVYLNEPGKVPEEKLLTEIYAPIG
jgi:effector-binding domain-containing protein